MVVSSSAEQGACGAMGFDPSLVAASEHAAPDDFVCTVCHQLVDISAVYTKCTHGARVAATRCCEKKLLPKMHAP